MSDYPSYSQMIQEAALKYDADNVKPYDSWRVSSIGKCPREHFYKRLGVLPTTPSDGNGVLRGLVGQAVHDLYAKLLEDYPPEYLTSVETEVEMYDKVLDLGGRLDELLTFDNEEIEMDDIKTQQEKAFWWMSKKSRGYTLKDGTERPPKNIEEQKPEHFKQVRSYMLLRKRAGVPVSRAKLVFTSMDTSLHEEVHVILKPEHEQEILDELAMLNKHWKEKTLPPCTCGKLWDGNGVKWCDYGNPKQEKDKRTKCCSEELFKEKK